MEIQRKLEMIANYGCYFICLVKAANKDLNNILFYYDEALRKGLIDEDCYIKDPVKLLKMLGREDINTVVKSDTIDFPSKIVVVMYEWKNYTHFCLLHSDEKLFDPLGDSNTVKYGKMKSFRLFK